MENMNTRTGIGTGNGAGIASLIIGVFSLAGVFIMPPVGLIFGIIGMAKAKKDDGAFSRAGYLTSKTGMIFCLILTILAIIIAVALGAALVFGVGDIISSQMGQQ